MNKPSSQVPKRYSQDDEISLVDLAKILIRRWKIMAATFLLVVLGALVYVLIAERTYDYVSIYQVAERAPGDDGVFGGLETPRSVVAKINNLYLGPETRELMGAEGLEGLPFEVAVSNPDETLLIRLSSPAQEADSELVTRMHDALLARMAEGQAGLVEQRRASLERQLQSAERALEAAEQSDSLWASDLIASYTDRIAEIQERLSQLKEGEVVQVAVQSLEPTGTSRSLIMALALVLGGMLAVIVAFFSQFVILVRDSLSEEA